MPVACIIGNRPHTTIFHLPVVVFPMDPCPSRLACTIDEVIVLHVAIREIIAWELKRELGWKVLGGSTSDAVLVSRAGNHRAYLSPSPTEPLSGDVLQTPFPYRASYIFIPFLREWHHHLGE